MLGERVLRVTVKPFMDMNTMIEERLTQCCVHVATVNGDDGAHQCAPFCAVQAWAPLSPKPDLDGGRAAARARGALVIDPRQVQPPHLTPTDRGAAPYDPLRLCVFATVALLGWLLGPWALLGFAGLGVAGYAKARRAGLTRSKCMLRDTRLVLVYLACSSQPLRTASTCRSAEPPEREGTRMSQQPPPRRTAGHPRASGDAEAVQPDGRAPATRPAAIQQRGRSAIGAALALPASRRGDARRAGAAPAEA